MIDRFAFAGDHESINPHSPLTTTPFEVVMDKNLLRLYIPELIGTFALVFIGAGAVCADSMTTAAELRPGVVGIAPANGLILAVALSVTLHISGGYLNPAITLMLWSFNRLDTARMLLYICAQLMGAVLAGLCLYGIFDD